MLTIASAKFCANSFAPYLDDTWKPTPKRTLSLGLRYENTRPWEDQTGRLFTVFIPYFGARRRCWIRAAIPYSCAREPTIPTRASACVGRTSPWRDNSDFAPRIGIACSPTVPRNHRSTPSERLCFT